MADIGMKAKKIFYGPMFTRRIDFLIIVAFSIGAAFFNSYRDSATQLNFWRGLLVIMTFALIAGVCLAWIGHKWRARKGYGLIK